MMLYLEIDAIPKKKDTRVHEIEFFSEAALGTILEQPDRGKKNGQRDLFFLILMYDTGARVQEMLDMKLGDLRLYGVSPYAIVTGKGSKTRHVPLMEKTCQHFDSYKHRFHTSGTLDEYLFYVDRKGVRLQMSIDNVEKFVARYGKKAHEISSEVPGHLYPHIIIPTFCFENHWECGF